MNPDYSDMFRSLHPGYFERESIRSLPPEEVFEEQLPDPHVFDPKMISPRGHPFFVPKWKPRWKVPDFYPVKSAKVETD